MKVSFFIKKIIYILKNLNGFYLPGNFIRLFAFFFVKGEITILEWDLLYNLALKVKKECLVEIGSFKGKSTIALALGAKKRKLPIFAIDPHENYIENKDREFDASSRTHFYKNMLLFNISKNVSLINLTSENAVKCWNKKISLLWIDGDHKYKKVLKDFQLWKKYVIKNGLIIFHDSVALGLGPTRVVKQALNSKKYKKIKQIDQTTVLQKISE
ncbi:class I SAM-dependent methyltransferase [Patescibacteria group bacterium]